MSGNYLSNLYNDDNDDDDRVPIQPSPCGIHHSLLYASRKDAWKRLTGVRKLRSSRDNFNSGTWIWYRGCVITFRNESTRFLSMLRVITQPLR